MSVSKASFAGSRSGSRPHPPHDNDRDADVVIVPEKRRRRNRTKASIHTFVSANIKPRPPRDRRGLKSGCGTHLSLVTSVIALKSTARFARIGVGIDRLKKSDE